MEAAVPIINKALDDVEPIVHGKSNTRKESNLSNWSMKNNIKAIKTKQQAVVLLLLILVIILTELVYNMLKKNQPSKT